MTSPPPKILILGCEGQLGWELQRSLAPLGQVVAWSRREGDLAHPQALAQQVETLAPTLVVNAAAYTAVDRAENEATLVHRINGEAPAALAAAAARCGARLLHYSSDYVFSGDLGRPYREDDTPQPLSVYGASKLAGAGAVLAADRRHLVFRTSWLYGRHGGNFLKIILRLAGERESLPVVMDQIGAPTPATLVADVSAHVAARLLRDPAVPGGLYHLSAAGHTSWHGFAQAVVAQARELGLELRLKAEAIHPITTAEYPLAAARPANSRLDCGKLEAAFGLFLPPWQTLLPHLLKDIVTP